MSPAVVATISAIRSASWPSARWRTRTSAPPSGVRVTWPRLSGVISAAVNETWVAGTDGTYGRVCHGKISASTWSPGSS